MQSSSGVVRARLDVFEQVTLVLIFAWFVYRMLADMSWLSYIYLLDQLIVLGFVLGRRRTSEISSRGGDWFAAFGGTFLPLLVVPVSDQGLVPTLLYLAIMLTGMAIHISAKLTLRRSMGIVAANRGIKMGGPYRIVRHPMYLGYGFVYAGVLLIWPTVWNLAVITTCVVLALWRIIAEERMLASDTQYQGLIERTRFRLLPGIY